MTRSSLPVRLAAWARRRADRPWLPAVLPAFPAADFLVPVMPNQLLLAALSALAPRRWPVFALAFALGAAIGGGVIAFALQRLGLDLGTLLDRGEGSLVAQALAHLRAFGLWYLAAMGLLPWTPRLTVVACALAGFPPLAIAATLALVRPIPCALLALLGAYGPRFAGKLPWLDRLTHRLRST